MIDSRKDMPNHHVNETINSLHETYSDLISYTTRVASYNYNRNEMSVFSCKLKTTAKHINAFLSFYGFETCTKKQLENYE